MYCEQLPLAGNLEQDLALPKVVGVGGKSPGLFGTLAAFVSGHTHQTLTDRQMIPAAGFFITGS
jgi:hypothetical protein